jgi:hypothetical protein
MPRSSRTTDPWSTLVGVLADALAARLDFPPRASSAAAASAVPASAAPARAGARRRRRKPSPALAESLTKALLDALAARLDFPPRASSAASTLAAPAAATLRNKPGRRPPARTARATGELLAYVSAHPGERLEQIAAALRRSTSDLAPAARSLLAQGRIRTRGTRRATRYYVA